MSTLGAAADLTAVSVRVAEFTHTSNIREQYTHFLTTANMYHNISTTSFHHFICAESTNVNSPPVNGLDGERLSLGNHF